jgi:hypothetical protein
MITITITTLVPLLSGRGCLHANAQGYRHRAGRLPNPHAGHPVAPEPPGQPLSLMEPGAPQASCEKPWATVWWTDITGCGFRVFAEFFASEEIARASARASGDPTAIVVSVAKKAKESRANIDSVLGSVRPVIGSS